MYQVFKEGPDLWKAIECIALILEPKERFKDNIKEMKEGKFNKSHKGKCKKAKCVTFLDNRDDEAFLKVFIMKGKCFVYIHEFESDKGNKVFEVKIDNLWVPDRGSYIRLGESLYRIFGANIKRTWVSNAMNLKSCPEIDRAYECKGDKYTQRNFAFYIDDNRVTYAKDQLPADISENRVIDIIKLYPDSVPEYLAALIEKYDKGNPKADYKLKRIKQRNDTKFHDLTMKIKYCKF